MFTAPIGLLSPKVSAIPRNGLVGEWLFSGNADDTSGNGNNGAVTGATLVNDRHSNPNSAYLFNGSTDYIKVLHDSVFDLGTGDFTFSLWDKQSSWGGIANYMLTKDTFSDYELRTLSTTELLMILGGTANQVIAPITASVDTWVHFLVTRVSGLVSWYENSVQVGTPVTNTSTLTNSKDLFFGARGNPSPERFMNGSLDDIRIYNRALTQEEIDTLYAE